MLRRTRGMKETEMRHIAQMIALIISEPESEEVKAKVKNDVAELTSKFPLYANRLSAGKSESITAS